MSAIPLEVIHEFLRMRIEQKPSSPSPLSIRQLMRELKEGIKIAIIQRERTISFIRTACDEKCNLYDKNVEAFDGSLCAVFNIYLEYLQKWILLHQNMFQKNLLEEEWKFCNLVDGKITDGKISVEKTFCTMLCTLLNLIGDRMFERIEDIAQDAHMKEKDDVNRKLDYIN